MQRLITLLTWIALLASPGAFAATLENVSILNVKLEKDHVVLKVHVSNGAERNFFYVDVLKSDPDSFEKLSLVIKKQLADDSFKLDLDIPNFSPSPNGSYYRSESVTFIRSE